MTKKAIFQQIDEALFKVIDQVKTYPAYHQFQDAISKLGEQEQKIINLTISYIIVAIPLVLVMIVFLMNNSLRSNIESKRAIQEEIQRFSDRRAISDSKGREIVLATPIAAQSELQSKIIQVLARINVSSTSVSIRSMAEGQSAGNLKEFNAELVFDKLSTKQFNDLVKELEDRERIRINGFLIENRIDDSVLKGRMALAFLTQSMQ